MPRLSCLAALPAILLGLAPAHAAPSTISLLNAVERAEAVTRGQVVEVDLDRDRQGRLVYEVDVAHSGSHREVKVDARRGKVLANTAQRMEGMLRKVTSGGYPGLDNAPALSTTLRALERSTGGRVTDVDFDVERGSARYEVELATAKGVAGLYIDPQTGKRLNFVVDD